MKASSAKRWQLGTLVAGRHHWALRIRIEAEDGVRRERRIRIGRRSDIRSRREARGIADAVARQLTGSRVAAGTVIDAAEYLGRFRRDRLPLMRPSTRASMRSILARHLEPALAGKRLDQVTLEDVQGLIGTLVAAGKAPDTVRAVIRVLRVIFRAARTSGYASPTLDMRDLQFPSLQRASEDPETFTVAELRRLTTEPPLPWRLIYAISAGLGLRCGEVLGLTWSDIELAEKRVSVRQAAVLGRVAPLKSETSRATLPLSDELSRRLSDFRTTWRPNPAELLFATRTGKPLHASAYWRRLQRDLERLGIPKRGTHAFRHSAISLLLASGLTPAAARDFARHADLAMTNRYSHATRDDLTRGAETLGQLTSEAKR